jgi:hypothetical protein
MELLHNKIKNIIFDQLFKKFGDKIGTENDTGFGTKIDIVKEEKNGYTYYEIKTGHSLKLCIREALSQLLEYSYYPDRKSTHKLVIITHHEIDNENLKYIAHLRDYLDIPIWYQYFNYEKQLLEDKLY